MFADVAHHTETNQHCLALGLGLIPMRRSDLRGGDNESVSSSDCRQAALRSAAYADTKETQERAGPLRSITRGETWSAFPLRCHDGAGTPCCWFHLFALGLCGRDAASNRSKQLCCFSAVKEQLCSTSFLIHIILTF